MLYFSTQSISRLSAAPHRDVYCLKLQQRPYPISEAPFQAIIGMTWIRKEGPLPLVFVRSLVPYQASRTHHFLFRTNTFTYIVRQSTLGRNRVFSSLSSQLPHRAHLLRLKLRNHLILYILQLQKSIDSLN
jgi:hypothetical protein